MPRTFFLFRHLRILTLVLSCAKASSYQPVSCWHESSDDVQALLQAAPAPGGFGHWSATASRARVVAGVLTRLCPGESVLFRLPRQRNEEGETRPGQHPDGRRDETSRGL